jgi:antitoxin VapB
MALNIKSRRADQLARELAEATGETITDAVTTAIAERLDRCRRSRAGRSALLENLRGRLRSYPVVDSRSDDEILGFDKDGLPD